jgi:WS/DGAT/MGAT family acyltransferase
MDMNRPLWDVYVVEGLDRIPGVAPGSYALLSRVHHAAIDGVSGAQFFVALNDMDALGTPAVEIKPHTVALGPPPPAYEVATRAWASNLTSPVKMMNTLLKLSPAMVNAARKSASGEDGGKGKTGVPPTRFNVAVTPHKMFDAAVFDLASLSAIRSLADGATVNDVVLAIVSGAVRSYLDDHGELPDETLIAVAPVNARRKGRDTDEPGNNISAMTVRLATDIADPVERLQAIRAFTAAAKEAKAGLSARVMTDLSKHIPGATMAAAARLLTSERFAPRQANLFVSNVPGPQIPLYMNGARLTHQFGMAPLAHNHGLFIAVPSYDGRISFCITSDRAIMPDIDHVRQCIEAAHAELLGRANGSARPKGKARAARRKGG